jgi:hypothetical protein
VDVASLGLSEDDRACVVARLPEGSDPEAAGQADVDVAVGQCTRSAEFGGLFVDGLRDTFGTALSEEQYGCLLDAYGRMTQEDIDAVNASALAGSAPQRDRAGQILGEMMVGCGVEP